jgi:maltokinase
MAGCLTRQVTRSALADLLPAWLPAQRWFAGSGATVAKLEIQSQVTLAEGDPELVHLMLDVMVGLERVRYQVPVGIRSALPDALTSASIGPLPDGRVAYDAAADPELTGILLRGIATGRQAGPLRFGTEPGAVIDVNAAARAMPPLASNTSVVFGDKAILKLLRRPFAGAHPDLEVSAALARNGSELVAAPLGWIELAGCGQSPVVQETAAVPESSVLAILSVFFPNSADGWSLATASLHESNGDFSSQARLLGEATARMHAELAEAFGSSVLSSYTLRDQVDNLLAELSQAIRVVPELREHAPAVRDCYNSLTESDSQVIVQRIHGDYHLAQVLSTEGSAGPSEDDPPGPPRRWVVLDFEGEPSVPLARRRAFQPPLRDVAGMLRSFDYAARQASLHSPDDRRLAGAAPAWAGSCQDAFCRGYADISGSDPRTSGPLLRALILQKAVYEVVYEARHRPDWLPIPLAAIAEASQ